jgi:hypothetical protein
VGLFSVFVMDFSKSIYYKIKIPTETRELLKLESSTREIQIYNALSLRSKRELATVPEASKLFKEVSESDDVKKYKDLTRKITSHQKNSSNLINLCIIGGFDLLGVLYAFFSKENKLDLWYKNYINSTDREI